MAGARTDKRTRILDAAEMLFADRGFDGTATKAIAEEAGVATGLVFYYFPSKDAILEALVEDRTLAAELPALLGATYHDDPFTFLVGLGLRMLRVLEDRRAMVRILVHELATSRPGEPAHLGTLFREGVERLAGELRRAVDDRRLPSVDTTALAESYLASLLMRALVGGPDDPEPFVVRTVGLLLPERK